MKRILAIVGPIVALLVFWTVITIIPMHALLLLALVIFSGAIRMWGIVYFGKKEVGRQ
jgi:hypothetical protein